MTERANLVTLPPDLIEVWWLVKAHRSPTEIAKELDFSRTTANKKINRLIALGVVFRVGDLPDGAIIDRSYPWHAPAEAPVLPPGATLFVEYTQGSQRDLRVRPVTRVSWPPWDIQGVPYLREDSRRPKEVTPDRALVVATNLDTGAEWEWRASIRHRWSETDTRLHLPDLIRGEIPDMTRAIAGALWVQAFLDITGAEGGHP